MASATTTTTTVSEKHSTQVFTQETSSEFLQRGTTLSISTSTPRPTNDVLSNQSPASAPALPPPSPHRTFSGPPVLSSSSVASPVSPRSAGYQRKSLRFEEGEHELKTTMTMPVTGNPKRGEMAKRRHSAEPKTNVYTECGRHSDDWLFGGWNVADKMRKILDRKDSKE